MSIPIDPNAPMTRRHSGSDWVERRGIPMSPLGRRVADLLGEWARGIYHIENALRSPRTHLDKANWCEVIYYPGYCTFDTVDGDDLTRLVFLAHDYGIRVELRPHGFGYMRLTFSQRTVRSNSMEGHPTIEQALAAHRAQYPAPGTAHVATVMAQLREALPEDHDLHRRVEQQLMTQAGAQ